LLALCETLEVGQEAFADVLDVGIIMLSSTARKSKRKIRIYPRV